MIHRKTHPEYVEDCKPCKWASISFGTVPGARRDQERGFTTLRRREKSLDRYREKRRAGEQPDGTTPEAIERHDRRVAAWENRESQLRDEHPTEVFEKMKKTTLNQRA